MNFVTSVALGASAEYIALAISFFAALGALLSGVLVAVITTNHEERRQMRDKMLQVADEFLSASSTALSSMREITPRERDVRLGWRSRLYPGVTTDSIDIANGLPSELAGRVSASMDRASAGLARVTLLFLPGSAAAQEARGVVMHLQKARESLDTYYQLGRASTTEDPEQRRQIIQDVMGAAGAAIAQRIDHRFAALGGAGAAAVAKAATSLGKPMKKASENAAEAQEAAQSAIDRFTTSASRDALTQTRWRPVYTVTANEEIKTSYVLPSMWHGWFRRPTISRPATRREENETSE
jgi:hypothetical protein